MDFIAGRYETGNLSQSKLVVEKNNSDITNQTWYEIYNKTKTISEGTKATSAMIWGCQKDAIFKWFLRQGGEEKINYVYYCNDKGYYNSYSVIPTGSVSTYRMNNIFDLSGNAMEYTMIGNYSRTFGGYEFGLQYWVLPADVWAQMSSIDSENYIGSRAILVF